MPLPRTTITDGMRATSDRYWMSSSAYGTFIKFGIPASGPGAASANV